MRGALFSFLLAVFAVSAQAQSARLLSLNSLEDGRAWEAVGRLEIAGVAFCTGALIAPDLVLTAAHCLYDKASGTRVPTNEIQFLAGWRNGRAAAYRLIKHAVHLPDYDYAQARDVKRVRQDIALLQLQHPIRNGSIQPFDTDERPKTGDRVGVVSYAHNRSEAPSLQEMCHVIGNQDGVLVMSCAVDFGGSGSPVFSFDGEHPRIVSVVSSKAKTQGQDVSLGTELEQPLQQLFSALSSLGQFQKMSADRKATGAKFIKP